MSSSGRRRALALPVIGDDDSFVKVVKILSVYFVQGFLIPSTYDQLRTTSAGKKVHDLVQHLVRTSHNPALINALLALKWHFSTLEVDDHRLNETRAFACEMTAYRFLSQVSERDVIDFCLYELPSLPKPTVANVEPCEDINEHSSLLPQFRARDSQGSLLSRPESKRIQLLRSLSRVSIGGSISSDDDDSDDDEEDDPTSAFTGLNALEIAAVADCKRFLSQRVVQDVIQRIFNGRIVFYQNLDVNSNKKPRIYNQWQSDIYIRLRVPKYIKAYEVGFLALFLAFYYVVIVQHAYDISKFEICLYIWLFSFAYDELGEFMDAGSLFYSLSIWNGADIAIILIGFTFVITRIVGIAQGDDNLIDTAYNILSLEALFMVPRICSVLSLIPYFGTLIPCLKKMAKDFVKFMAVVAIIYLGFLTTFSLLARDTFTLAEMSWLLIKIFLGSSFLGFDVMNDIDPHLGPPLMLIFIVMTNILLITSLISILSDSFSKVTLHAREEYLLVRSVFVLEASTSNRLTHFYPPFNLVPLLLLRPMRLFFPAERLRYARISLLKILHSPIVFIIWIFETTYAQISPDSPIPSRVKSQSRPFLAGRSDAIDFGGDLVDGNTSEDDGAGDYSMQGKKVGGMVVVSNAELEAKVADLTVKISELSALLMAGKTGTDT